MSKSRNLKSALFFLTFLTTAFPLRAMNRGGAEERGDEVSLPKAPVAFMEKAEQEEDEGFDETPAASGYDMTDLLVQAEQGDAEAQYQLARRYKKGKGIEKDLAQAATYYERAAAQGHADAQLNLGVRYYNGEGVERSLQEAARWFRKAATQGNRSAQFNLGSLYFHGEGVEKNVEKAKKWYLKAAAQGHPEAIKALENLESPPAPHFS